MGKAIYDVSMFHRCGRFTLHPDVAADIGPQCASSRCGFAHEPDLRA
jgi:hypothetical protein